jgi:hypothetical protein
LALDIIQDPEIDAGTSLADRLDASRTADINKCVSSQPGRELMTDGDEFWLGGGGQTWLGRFPLTFSPLCPPPHIRAANRRPNCSRLASCATLPPPGVWMPTMMASGIGALVSIDGHVAR